MLNDKSVVHFNCLKSVNDVTKCNNRITALVTSFPSVLLYLLEPYILVEIKMCVFRF
jgi:hypothetical protein